MSSRSKARGPGPGSRAPGRSRAGSRGASQRIPELLDQLIAGLPNLWIFVVAPLLTIPHADCLRWTPCSVHGHDHASVRRDGGLAVDPVIPVGDDVPRPHGRRCPHRQVPTAVPERLLGVHIGELGRPRAVLGKDGVEVLGPPREFLGKVCGQTTIAGRGFCAAPSST